MLGFDLSLTRVSLSLFFGVNFQAQGNLIRYQLGHVSKAELFLMMDEDIPEVELLLFFRYEGVVADKNLTKSLENKILSLRHFL